MWQTFQVWSVMHGRYEDITRVDFTLTEPSQMIVGSGELWFAPLRKLRRGDGSFDLSWVQITDSHFSTKRESCNKTYSLRWSHLVFARGKC